MSDPHQPHNHARYPYGVPIPTSSSSSHGNPSASVESDTSAMQRDLAQADARRDQRQAKTASWGSYNQFVGVDAGPSTPNAQYMGNPYDNPLTPQRSYDHTPAGSPSPSPAPGTAYHYRPTRQASREADIADGIRPRPASPSSPAPEERMSWHAKGGNKLRRVKERIQYDEDGKPRREKKDKYGVKEIPEGWTAEDEEAEREFLASSMFNWQELMTWRFWIRKEWWHWYVILVVIGVLVLLMTIYHDDIVKWLTPAANWMKNLPAGWVIPIAVMFVISFPPLFGHEIVAILCGVVWGLWVGFGIVAAGTMLGEIGNFYAFKYVCQSRAEKYEKKNINYACLAHVIRHGGFMIIVAARLSAIPGHLTTAIFATCGQNIFIFSLAAFVTLPKQLVVVYLGVLFNAEAKSKTSQAISYTVLGIGALVTVGSAWYIYHEMNKARIVIWRRHRMALAQKGVALNELVYDANDVEVGGTGLRDNAGRPMLPTYATQGYNDSHEEVMDEGSPRSGARPGAGDRASYATPYDIAYEHDGNMSIYHVDGLSERLETEKRVSQQLLDRRSSRGSSSAHATPQIRVDHAGAPPSAFPPSFPQAYPAPSLQRAPSDASTYSVHPIAPASFPAPVPSTSHSHSQSEHTAYSAPSAYSQPSAPTHAPHPSEGSIGVALGGPGHLVHAQAGHAVHASQGGHERQASLGGRPSFGGERPDRAPGGFV